MRRKCHVVAAPSHAGGLFNQIESLLGYAYIALTKNATLALPPLAPHVVWPELVPFEDVFEPEPFISAMLQQGLAVVRNASELPACAVTRPDGRRGRHIYGAFLRAAPNSSLSRLEDAAYRGLVPVGRLRQRAREFLAQSGLARAEGGFGCLHARIERDMQFWCGRGRVGSGGPPPTLAQYLTQLAKVEALRRAPQIFVAVGKHIPRPQDERLLDGRHRTPWGALLTRRAYDGGAGAAPAPSFQRLVTVRVGPGRRNHTSVATSSYLDEALVDALVCREASWFVGWSTSTFATGMARHRMLDRGEGYYSVCNTSVRYLTDGGRGRRLCPD